MLYDRRPVGPIAPGLLVELKAQKAKLAAKVRLREPTRLADRLTNSRYRTRTDTLESLSP